MFLREPQWLWAQEDYFEAVDVLFVDEAGQMSLANVLAVSQAAKSVVLLGDPQQLEQPLRGSHPEGADALGSRTSARWGKDDTARKGPFPGKNLAYASEADASSRPKYSTKDAFSSRDGLENQRINGHPWLGESGLWYIPVEHQGNQNASPEEVEIVAGLGKQPDRARRQMDR